MATATMSGVTDLNATDFLSLSHVNRATMLRLFETAAAQKRDIRPFARALAGKSFALLFEKPSLRTKMSFEVGIWRLGGQPVFMDHGAQRLGARESVRDYAKNLERWVQAIVARVYSQAVIDEMAEAARCPVINALSDRFHPCQGLADLFTLYEMAGGDAGRLRETRIAYVGDGNNVCHSLMHAASILGVDITVITPKGYAPAMDVTAECDRFASLAGSKVNVTTDVGAAEGHGAVYTDVWVSMGQAGGVDEATKRRKVFAKYQVNAELMAKASRGLKKPAVFMHCLPAQRGVEVTDEVIDSAQSIVYDQAENRMHAQNALLIHMLGEQVKR